MWTWALYLLGALVITGGIYAIIRRKFWFIRPSAGPIKTWVLVVLAGWHLIFGIFVILASLPITSPTDLVGPLFAITAVGLFLFLVAVNGGGE